MRHAAASTAFGFVLVALTACAAGAAREIPPATPVATAAPVAALPVDPLFARIAALDTALFAAFNGCADPAQLKLHEGYFAEDVEFYHDNGGVTWDRASMLANTAKYACGHYTRELVAGSLEVHAIKGFGAIAEGVHRFCQAGSDKCEGLAKFVMVWREQDGQWQVTRVLSYGHRPNP